MLWYHQKCPAERRARRLPNTRKASDMSYILIIDDDTNSRKLLSANLEKRGHHTMTMPHIADARLEGRKKSPDLILVGINLPCRHGEADVEQLRSLPDMTLIPIFVLSADPPDRRWMARWSVESCLLKPFDVRQLLVWLQPWLRGTGARTRSVTSCYRWGVQLRAIRSCEEKR